LWRKPVSREQAHRGRFLAVQPGGRFGIEIAKERQAGQQITAPSGGGSIETPDYR
jgi:hypothetical protein